MSLVYQCDVCGTFRSNARHIPEGWSVLCWHYERVGEHHVDSREVVTLCSAACGIKWLQEHGR